MKLARGQPFQRTFMAATTPLKLPCTLPASGSSPPIVGTTPLLCSPLILQTERCAPPANFPPAARNLATSPSVPRAIFSSPKTRTPILSSSFASILQPAPSRKLRSLKESPARSASSFSQRTSRNFQYHKYLRPASNHEARASPRKDLGV